MEASDKIEHHHAFHSSNAGCPETDVPFNNVQYIENKGKFIAYCDEVTTLPLTCPHALKHSTRQVVRRLCLTVAECRAVQTFSTRVVSDVAGSFLSALFWTITQRLPMGDKSGVLLGHTLFA